MYAPLDGTWPPRAYDTPNIRERRREFAANHMKRTGRLAARHYCAQNKDASLAELETEAAQ
ncbi:MAG: hypothetical protein AAF441_29570 [Pseudomonadota bacterium]